MTRFASRCCHNQGTGGLWSQAVLSTGTERAVGTAAWADRQRCWMWEGVPRGDVGLGIRQRAAWNVGGSDIWVLLKVSLRPRGYIYLYFRSHTLQFHGHRLRHCRYSGNRLLFYGPLVILAPQCFTTH